MDDLVLEKMFKDASKIRLGVVKFLDPVQDFRKPDQEVVGLGLNVLLSIDLHDSAQLLVEFLLRKHS